MVQLFPSQASDAVALSESREERDARPDGSSSAESPRTLSALQLALNPSATVYPGYETYIEDGLICLRHKIRNIEKKKVASCLYCVHHKLTNASKPPDTFVNLLLNTVYMCSSSWKATKCG